MIVCKNKPLKSHTAFRMRVTFGKKEKVNLVGNVYTLSVSYYRASQHMKGNGSLGKII